MLWRSMKRKLLDILACPIDKHYPLELMEFRTEGEIILDGVLLCTECKRYFPIIDEIPVMLPDDLRSKNEDIGFLNRWKEKLPEEVIRRGLPHNLATA
jgi:uncharacterized protein YbaR (Trm112 family)